MYNIKLKLANLNECYDWVLSDLETLEKWSKKLVDELPPADSIVSDKSYLQTTAIHILLVSQVEYLLKSLGRIGEREQWKIKDIIKDSKVLTQLEKDYLIYLFLTRHTIVHNGNHFNKKFHDDFKKDIKQLKINIPSDNFKSLIPPEELIMYINLVERFIVLDIARENLTDEEIKVAEESLK